MTFPHSHRHASRAGLATVEALAAMVVLAVGVVALGGVATVALRGGDDAELRRRAATFARRSLDSIVATPCARVVTGADSSAGATVRWTVDDSISIRIVRATLRYDLRGATRRADYELVVPCR